MALVSHAQIRVYWDSLSSIPDREGMAGMFAGVSGGALFCMGGANFPDKRPHYRRYEEFDEKPEATPVKRVKIGDQVILASDEIEVSTGIIEPSPAMDWLGDLAAKDAEAKRLRKKRLRQIALADDDWLMSL